jgi:uncharacterized protein YjiS (DUF1127 family)
MMTQPIAQFQVLSTESQPTTTKMVQPKLALSFEERQTLEMRARYARAEMTATVLVDGLLWVTAKIKAAIAWFKADMKLRAAEAQLFRMSDRELADLGLTRAEIPFAVNAAAEGLVPEIKTAAEPAVAANRNDDLPRIFWAGRA